MTRDELEMVLDKNRGLDGKTTLKYENGITVRGKINSTLNSRYESDNIILLSFDPETEVTLGDRIFFNSGTKQYNMLLVDRMVRTNLNAVDRGAVSQQ